MSVVSSSSNSMLSIPTNPTNMTMKSDNTLGLSKGAAPPVMIGSKPTLITLKNSPMRFLIMDAPRPSNLHLYIKECRKQHVTDIVRVCEPTYSATGLESAGINLHEMPYSDGHSPPKHVLDSWLTLVDQVFFQPRGSGGSVSGSDTSTPNGVSAVRPTMTTPTVAVHCVAGLGRAPVLVAIALIEFLHLDPVEAVALIRQHRRGAINDKQLNWLERYQRSYSRMGSGAGCCVVM